MMWSMPPGDPFRTHHHPVYGAGVGECGGALPSGGYLRRRRGVSGVIRQRVWGKEADSSEGDMRSNAKLKETKTQVESNESA